MKFQLVSATSSSGPKLTFQASLPDDVKKLFNREGGKESESAFEFSIFHLRKLGKIISTLRSMGHEVLN